MRIKTDFSLRLCFEQMRDENGDVKLSKEQQNTICDNVERSFAKGINVVSKDSLSEKINEAGVSVPVVWRLSPSKQEEVFMYLSLIAALISYSQSLTVLTWVFGIKAGLEFLASVSMAIKEVIRERREKCLR